MEERIVNRNIPAPTDHQAAMEALADDTLVREGLTDGSDVSAESAEVGFEGNSRATGQSKIEKTPRAPGVQSLWMSSAGQQRGRDSAWRAPAAGCSRRSGRIPRRILH